MAKKKLSRDQKRKQMLAKRAHGGAGRAGAQVEFVTGETEQIISETFLSFGRGMHDGDVLDALRQLVVDVQKGQVSQESAGAELPNAKGALIWNIKQAWGEKRTLANVPGLMAAQGLQMLAHRVDDISAPGESRSYLRFLQGTQDGARALVAEGEGGQWSDDEAALRRSGLAWLKSSNMETHATFKSAAEALIGAGKARAVTEVCQYLYGTVQQAPVEQALRPLLDAAHQQLLEAAASAVSEPEDVEATRRVTSGMIEFASGEHQTPAYLAQPDDGAAHSAIIVIQEWWGLVPHIKAVADRFAAEGFVALAPDLYYGKSADEPDEARKLAMALDRPRALAEIAAAARYMTGMASVAPKKIGVVGWCMGGGLSLSAAANNGDIGAAVAFYGRVLSPEDTARLHVPVLGLFGELDQGIPVEGVRAFEAELVKVGVPHEIHIYPGAQHAFFNDARPQAYHPEAARDAWERTLAWFRKYLV